MENAFLSMQKLCLFSIWLEFLNTSPMIIVVDSYFNLVLDKQNILLGKIKEYIAGWGERSHLKHHSTWINFHDIFKLVQILELKDIPWCQMARIRVVLYQLPPVNQMMTTETLQLQPDLRLPDYQEE